MLILAPSLVNFNQLRIVNADSSPKNVVPAWRVCAR